MQTTQVTTTRAKTTRAKTTQVKTVRAKSIAMARIAPLALLVGVALVGCGGGGGTASASSLADGAAKVSADSDEAMEQYERCLADHGVEIVDLDASGPNVSFSSSSDDGGESTAGDSFEDQLNAQNACEQYLPASDGVDEDRPSESELVDEQADVAACLSDAGYDVTVDENNNINAQLDPNANPAEYEAAYAKCAG